MRSVVFVALMVFLGGCGKPTERASEPVKSVEKVEPKKPKLTKEDGAKKVTELMAEFERYADGVEKLLKVWDKSKPQDRDGLKISIKSKITSMKELLDEVESVYNRVEPPPDAEKQRVFKLRLKDKREWLRATEVELKI